VERIIVGIKNLVLAEQVIFKDDHIHRSRLSVLLTIADDLVLV
jgi:hypothetical protein